MTRMRTSPIPAEPVNYLEWLPRVVHTPDLDGGGKVQAPVFASILEGRQFKTAFEWCAGPAWIGLWLLEIGICRELVTGDVNEDSVSAVRQTSMENGYNVRSYVSDNMDSIPSEEVFDLVVGTPPNYCNIQESHPWGYLRNDLRPSDPGWEIHKKFYNGIGKHLHSDSVMYVSEVSPYTTEVFFGGELYDLRPEIPMEDFISMTSSNDLKITKATPYDWPLEPDTDCRILEIRPNKKEKPNVRP